MSFKRGDRAERIAGELWDLDFCVKGGTLDRRGIDAYLKLKPVQIKGDIRIADKGNLYHEIYEKTKGYPEQDWRHSPTTAHLYIFVTHYKAYMVKTDALARAEKNMALREISTTSMGYVIPISAIHTTDIEVKEHVYSLDENISQPVLQSK